VPAVHAGACPSLESLPDSSAIRAPRRQFFFFFFSPSRKYCPRHCCRSHELVGYSPLCRLPSSTRQSSWCELTSSCFPSSPSILSRSEPDAFWVFPAIAAPSTVSASRRPPFSNRIVPQDCPTLCAAVGPPGASRRPPEFPHHRPPPLLNHPTFADPFSVSVRGPAATERTRGRLLSVVVPSVCHLITGIAGAAGPPPGRRAMADLANAPVGANLARAAGPSQGRARPCGPPAADQRADFGPLAGFGFSKFDSFILNSRNRFELLKSFKHCIKFRKIETKFCRNPCEQGKPRCI
jgi:hypothetical protein